jgi:hypothetical protein
VFTGPGHDDILSMVPSDIQTLRFAGWGDSYPPKLRRASPCRGHYKAASIGSPRQAFDLLPLKRQTGRWPYGQQVFGHRNRVDVTDGHIPVSVNASVLPFGEIARPP